MSLSRLFIRSLDTIIFFLLSNLQSAVTHKKIEEGINSVSFLWTAPKGLSEKVRIHATVARNGGTFWVNQASEPITVNA